MAIWTVKVLCSSVNVCINEGAEFPSLEPLKTMRQLKRGAVDMVQLGSQHFLQHETCAPQKTAKRGLPLAGFNALTGLTAEPTAAWRALNVTAIENEANHSGTKTEKKKKKNTKALVGVDFVLLQL